ncbi:hypothetical protein RCH12_002507 [Cryobacterium sp. MP_3.1]|uniref:phosphoribosyltransferase domain-containing protein n=1 Tax=Cryobacterium sp. MP_3.1 TaxID=3071711 RepID=UPI002DFAE4E7|nr:hypothetical protein [Cryobacterium sp. MP_3.1]
MTVATALDIHVATDHTRSILGVDELVGIALRHNPKRAHLLVSTVLAKHVPTVPGIALAAGELLGLLVSAVVSGGVSGGGPPAANALGDRFAVLVARLAEKPESTGAESLAQAHRDLTDLRRDIRAATAPQPDVVTFGYAETATGLGQLVADALGAYYLHSTRHAPAGATPFAGFAEEHSHATDHALLPTDPHWLRAGGTTILVDDELSTGTTVINTITALHALIPQSHWVIASLIDLRSPADLGRFDELATTLGTRISVVCLSAGSIGLPADVLPRAGRMIESMPVSTPAPAAAGEVHLLDCTDLAPLRSARFGTTAPADASVAAAIADRVAALLPAGETTAHNRGVLVLGSEEFIALPMLTADELGRAAAPQFVRFSTSTRSPIAALDAADYPIRSAISFRSHDTTSDGDGVRFAYNLTAGQHRFGTVVFMPEPGTDPARLTGADGVIDALRRVSDRIVVVLLTASAPTDGIPTSVTTSPLPPAAVLPHPLSGPAFGSYAAEDVSWLLQDLQGVALEAPAEEREHAIQTGAANYAESLPIEYLPSPEYEALYREALQRSGRRLAVAVGVVTDLALAARGDRPVFVSLARAGTPIGILMRRWAQHARGIDVPHYTMSIVRGVGLDQTALRYLAAHHDPEQIIFVDGWTGKGAIARELSAAIALFGRTDGVFFRDDLAVLADPGHCVTIHGTREDYLIPSACLNSTVSGLVSRTVFNRDLIGEDEFHGAKFYAELSPNDVSGDFLDTVCGYFADVAADVAAGVAAASAEDRTPSWVGWKAVEKISTEYGINDVNLVKPGVGETTRVLLRRVPWKVLVRADAVADVAHVLLLAEQRGVPIEVVPDLPYSCVGLIRPGRGIAGAQ